ncbi:MAG: hypothetical protein FGM37_04305 [Phycisphaerales bacterium]|nr:hypothetical protein [Phycisphaerales bacterium]
MAGFAVGAILVVAAVVAVLSNRSLATAALDSAKGASAGTIALLVGGAIVNLVASAAGLRALMLRHGQVGAMEMQAVIASATLLNYAPLRPGLASRAAYHHVVNGIPVMATALTVVQSMALALCGIAWLVASAWLMRAGGGFGGPQVGFAFVALAPAIGVAGIMAAPAGSWRRTIAVAWLWRCVDMSAWVVRYHAAFAITGISLSLADSAVAAAGAGAANLVPLVGNGLGVREWLVGIMGSSMRLWTMDAGLAADIVNRAGDLIVCVPLGLAALPFVAARLRHATRAQRVPDAAHAPSESPPPIELPQQP